MLTTPRLEKYRQGDFVQYMNNIIEIFYPARVSTFNVTSQFNDLQQAMQSLQNAWQPKEGSELTREIAALDQQRDIAFNGFKLTVDNWATHHYLPEMQQAAFIVSDKIAAHGSKIYLMRYQLQTATLNSIIRELEDVLSGSVSILGLTNWLNHIKALNTEFNAKYMQRVTSMSRQQTGIIEELIVKTTIVFRQLASLIEARFRIAETDNPGIIAELTPVIDELNMLTQQYNDAVNRYKGNGEALPDDSNEPPAAAAPDLQQ